MLAAIRDKNVCIYRKPLIAAVIALIITLLVGWWYIRRISRECTEGFDLDQIKKEVDIAYQTDNPQVQYSVNPIPSLLNFIKGRSYYPNTLPRRPDALIRPITERVVLHDATYNKGNMGTVSNPPYSGPNTSGIYRSYRYPHNDLLYKPWQLSIDAPYLH